MEVYFFTLHNKVDDRGASLVAFLRELWKNRSARYAMHWACNESFEASMMDAIAFVQFLVECRGINQQRLAGTVVEFNGSSGVLLPFIQQVLKTSPSRRPLHLIDTSKSDDANEIFASIITTELRSES